MLEDEKKNKALNGTHAHVFDLGRAHFESPQKIQKDQEFVIDAKTVYVVEKDGAFDDPKSLGFDHHPVKPINEDLNKQNSIPNYNTVILAIGQSEYANQTFFIKASNLFFEAKPNEEGHSFKDSLLANITGFKLMGTEGLNSPEIFDLDMQKEGMEGWTPLIKKDEWKQEGTVPEFGDPENSNNQSSVKNPVTDADKSHDDSEKWTEHTIDYTPVPLVPTDHNKKPVNAKKTDLKQFFTISDETVQRHQQLVTEQKVEHKKGLERLTQSTQTPNQSPVPPLNNSSLISNISTVFWNIVTTATEGFWGNFEMAWRGRLKRFWFIKT
ncbi:hypothetical protein IPH67_02280 [bacterium]|nr:MAG: hypothetical protein IPH67_02280 [bacterium]